MGASLQLKISIRQIAMLDGDAGVVPGMWVSLDARPELVWEPMD